MSEKVYVGNIDQRPKGPNFLLVVVLSSAVILIFCVCAYLFLSDFGRQLLPGLHPQPHPTSLLYQGPPHIQSA